MKPAFFHTIDGDPRALQPQPHAKGAWNPMLVFGRLLGGLLARTIDLDGAGPDFTCTRLTIDLFRSAPLGPPITCRAATIRQGRRIRVVLATVELDGEPIAQATAVLLRRGSSRSRITFSRRAGSRCRPRRTIRSPRPRLPGIHGWLTTAPRRAPRACSAGCGSGSPTTWSIRSRYIGRPPVGELIGLEPTGHISGDGVAVGECRLHDGEGPFGFVATTSVANPPLRGRS